MGILDGKRLLITGITLESSIAFHVAKVAQQQGAQVVLSSFGRTRKLTEKMATRLPHTAPVIELDVTNADDLAALPQRVREHVDGLDGVLHAIAFAPKEALGGNFLTADWEHAATALHVSAYSLKSLTMAALPLLPEQGGSVVGLDFDAQVAWPAYDWMGVAKAALESTTRYLAKYLGPQGVRVNLVAAGPLATPAGSSIDGFAPVANMWSEHSPLGWNLHDPTPTAKACVALFSDFFPATTGEIIHVDGGLHAVTG